MRFPRITFLLLAALLYSCHVTQEFTGVEQGIDIDQFPIDQITTDSTTLADLTIDEFFESPELLGLIRTGLSNNYNLGMAVKSIEIAHAYFLQGKAAYFPTLSAGPQIAYGVRSENTGGGSGSGSDRFYQGYQLGVNASWEVDLWGKLRSQEKVAFADYQAANAGLKAVQTELIAQIASLYYRLIALDARKVIAERTLENWRSSVNTIELLKQAGTVTEVAVQQNIAQLYFAQALLVDIDQQIFLLENTLNTLLARPYQPIERQDWNSIQMPEYFNTGLPAQLLANRPDLRHLEYQIRGDFENINVARTYFYPALRINGSGGLESVHIGDFLNPGSLFANVAGGLTQPIFDRRLNKTQLEVANLQYEQSILQYENTYLHAIQEVTDALVSARKSEEKIAYQQSQLEALNRAVDFSEQLLNNGLANYLEVLRAQDQVFSTELGMVDTRLHKISSIVSLYKALGGGWNPDSIEALKEE